MSFHCYKCMIKNIEFPWCPCSFQWKKKCLIFDWQVQNPAAPHGEPPKSFTFDTVFAPGSKQTDLYNQTARSIVDAVMEGYNGKCYIKTCLTGILQNDWIDLHSGYFILFLLSVWSSVHLCCMFMFRPIHYMINHVVYIHVHPYIHTCIRVIYINVYVQYMYVYLYVCGSQLSPAWCSSSQFPCYEYDCGKTGQVLNSAYM